MNAIARSQRGQFANGNAGAPGHPPIERERKYLETMSSVCSQDDWKEICQRAVKDAKNGDYRARDWLTKYLVGEPKPSEPAPLPRSAPTAPEVVTPEIREAMREAMEAQARLKRVQAAQASIAAT